MLSLPPAAGPISASLLEYLRGGGDHEPALELGDDAIGARDLQLALYLLNELHYDGIAGVDDEFEWNPRIASLRAALGNAMLDQLLATCPLVDEVDPAYVPQRIFELIAADDEVAPPLSRYLESHASLHQFREFVIQRSAYQLKEADPHTFAIPRIRNPAKSAMVEIQADEYGGGDPARMHSELFAKTMRELGLDSSPGAYVEVLPAETLATVNLITLFGLQRRWRGALVGHLAGFEITSPQPNRRYANGLRRLGLGADATEFYDEHVEADSVHENVAAYDLAGALARQEPKLGGQILFGVSALLYCERRFAGHILDSFEAGRSSLESFSAVTHG